MNVLLINPYIYDFTAYDLWLRPLGLLYIAAVLRKYTGCQLYWLDTLDRFQKDAFVPGDKTARQFKADGRGKFHREAVAKPSLYRDVPRKYARFGIPLDSFAKKLDHIPPVDLILVTTLMTYWIDGVAVTVEMLKKRFPKAPVAIGGILPSLVPAGVLKHRVTADFFIPGRGEEAVLQLVHQLGGRVYPHPGLSVIDNLPYPAVEFLSSRDSLPLITSRGCPFRCTYCASDRLNPGFEERTAAGIFAEIQHMNQTHGARHFTIFDDALLVNKHKRFLKAFHQVNPRHGLKFHTPNGLHTREIDRQTADTLFAAGFKKLRLSFESTRPDILSRSSDKVSVAQMVEAVENLEAAGYKRKDIAAYVLFGLPGQRTRDVEEALDFIGDLGIKPHLSYFSPVPGTRDFNDLQEKGILAAPVDLYETNKIYFVYQKSGFSHGEIEDIKNRTTNLQARL
jgi:radical SAM superfamily enzyme YgiQ (UPF0313 family)